jgi:hypothetical protein
VVVVVAVVVVVGSVGRVVGGESLIVASGGEQLSLASAGPSAAIRALKEGNSKQTYRQHE